jgi:hypothetical protein
MIESPIPWPHTDRETMFTKKAFEMARDAEAVGFLKGLVCCAVLWVVFELAVWIGRTVFP